MIDNAPDAIKKTYLKMKGEHGKKLELKSLKQYTQEKNGLTSSGQNLRISRMI